MIEVYSIVVACLFLLGFGVQIANDNYAWVFEGIILLPIFGRVFGWW